MRLINYKFVLNPLKWDFSVYLLRDEKNNVTTKVDCYGPVVIWSTW